MRENFLEQKHRMQIQTRFEKKTIVLNSWQQLFKVNRSRRIWDLFDEILVTLTFGDGAQNLSEMFAVNQRQLSVRQIQSECVNGFKKARSTNSRSPSTVFTIIVLVNTVEGDLLLVDLAFLFLSF